MRNPSHRGRPEDDLAMTSMIDVVFLLLVFFVWTSSFDRPERELAGGIAMPSQPAADDSGPNENAGKSPRETTEPKLPEEEIVLRIIADGDLPRYQIGAVRVDSFAALSAKLQAIARLPGQVVLIIDPDDEIPTFQCVAVFDVATKLGMKKVFFAVEAQP